MSWFARLFGRSKPLPAPAPPPLLPEVITAQEHETRRVWRALTGEGLRLEPAALDGLAALLGEYCVSPVEAVEPLAPPYVEAEATFFDLTAATAWLGAHRDRSPLARGLILTLETVGAIDLGIDVVVTGLVEGSADSRGLPAPDALIGAYASHWDEVSGDLLVRPIVAWGGRAISAGTERQAKRALSRLAIALRSDDLFVATADPAASVLPPADERGGLTCPGCRRLVPAVVGAFFCPKCGTRLLRN